MIEAVVYIPVRDNDGRPFPRRSWAELEARFEAFGGVTRAAAVTGLWINEGRRYRDRSWPYAVSLASWRQLPAWLALVAWAQARFAQEAMYIRVAGVTDIVDFRN